MEGQFIHEGMPVRWTVDDDGEISDEGGQEWVLHVRMDAVSILRRYPDRVNFAQADRDARQTAETLVQLAAEWLK